MKLPFNLTMSSINNNQFSKATLSWASISGTVLAVPSLEAIFAYLANIFIILDTIYRVIITFKYIRKYLTNTSIGVPLIGMAFKIT